MTVGAVPTDANVAAAGDAWWDALPAGAREMTRRTKRLDHLAHTALTVQHWPVPGLVERCTSGDLGNNAGGVITSRLEWCARNPPATQPAENGARLAFCSDECRLNAGWILQEKSGKPLRRCPCRTRGANF